MKFAKLKSRQEVAELIAWHNSNSTYVVLDTETTDKNPRKATLVDVQLSGREPEEAFAFDAEFAGELRKLDCLQIWHNFKYDWKVLYLAGIDLRGKPMLDTMLMHHLVDENADHDLDSIVKARWQDGYKEAFWAKYKAYQESPLEERLDYGCRDIVYTRRFYEELADKLKAQRPLVQHVHRLAESLFDTEISGIRVDLTYLTEMGGELKKDIVATEANLRRLAGAHCQILELEQWANETQKAWTPRGKKWQTIPKPEFNFSSSRQIVSLLYDRLMLPVQKHPQTKKPTADDAALERLGDAHPILPELRRLRKYSKMHGAFIEGILDRTENGRVYPSFNVNGTVTGRISHSDPNMGQIPSKDEWSKIRGIFVPEPGNKLITCDYSQLEVCIAAHFSMDKNLLKIIYEGASKHDITAAGLGIPRGLAKTVNFAAQYQCSPRKIAELLSCSQAEGVAAFNKYWETYAGEKAVIDECKGKVDRGIPIVNPFGRHRRFPTTFSESWQKEAAYRQAYSSLIQGTGSEFTSYSLYTLSEWLKATGYGRAWFTVHDEVLLECQECHVEEVRSKTVDVMVGAAKLVNLRVPLSVSCSEGLDRWTK